MKKKRKIKSEPREQWQSDLEIIKILLILMTNKCGVNKKDIAQAIGISKGRLSQILNPKKYS